MSMRVTELVRSIRACKTAAEERAVISKECALIRTAFRDHDTVYRQRNVAKLLFIHLLGYPTQFAHMECLKLVASQKFSEKRVGYLGLTQLLDENSDVLMLVTNSIGQDLHHTNYYVSGLALTALGDIANAEMCRALSQEIYKLMSVSNPYIKKKAILCAVRMVRKVKDLQDTFDDKISGLLDDRSHGVLLAACALMCTLLEADRDKYVELFRKNISQLIHILQQVLMSGYSSSSEYDFNGIIDPFLQARILEVLRLLGQGSAKRSQKMVDVLTQVATNTEASKSTGNAILYEGVRAIMSVKADSGLRVLGVNILAKFLLSKENRDNFRYVALAILQQVVKVDMNAVQRHRETILECLKGTDTSIQRRALDLTFALIDEENIKSMTKELLNLLLTADSEFKSDLASKICVAVERYAPNRRWQIDTLVRAMCLAGNQVQDDVRNTFISVVLSTPELQQYAVIKLYFSVQENLSEEALVQCAVWCIGEYGDLLTSGGAVGPEGKEIRASPGAVLDLLDTIGKRTSAADSPLPSISAVTGSQSPERSGNQSPSRSPASAAGPGVSAASSFAVSPMQVTQEFLLTCLLKLTTRFPSEINRIQRMQGAYCRSAAIELQQRACEADELMSHLWDDLRPTILDRMPLPPEKATVFAARPAGDDSINEVPPNGEGGTAATSGGGSPNLLDLDNLLDLEPDSTAQSKPKQTDRSKAGGEFIDTLLKGLPATKTPAESQPALGGGGASLLEDLTSGAGRSSIPPLTAFDKDGLKIVFEYPEGFNEQDGKLALVATTTNTSSSMFTKYFFEVAVPKYMKLQMDSASGDTLLPNGAGSVSQAIKLDISSAKGKALAVKLRISFLRDGQQVQQLVDVQSLRPS